MKFEKFKNYQVSNLKDIVGGSCQRVYCSDANGNSGSIDTDSASVSAAGGAFGMCDSHFSWRATTAGVAEQ